MVNIHPTTNHFPAQTL